MIEWLSLIVATIAVIHSICVRNLQIKTNEELDNLAVILRMIKSDISLITTQTNLVTKRLENKINEVNENCLTKCLNIDSKYKDKLDNVCTHIVGLKVKFNTILTNLNDENGNFNDKFTEINNELCKIVSDIERIKKERRIEKYGEDNI